MAAPSPPSSGSAAGGRRPGRRVGYVVAVAVNGLFLWIAHRLLDWDWPGFLTADWEQVLPVVTASLVATMVANAVFVVRDPPWVRHLLGAVTAGFSLAAGIRIYQVFPFDFAGYGRDWSWLVRVVLLVGIVATAIATVANLAQFAVDLLRSEPSSPR